MKLLIDIAIKEVLGKLPLQELRESLEEFVEPMMKKMPDKRLADVISLAIEGILGSESPVVSQTDISLFSEQAIEPRGVGAGAV